MRYWANTRLVKTGGRVERIDVELIQPYLWGYAAGGPTMGALERAKARARNAVGAAEKEKERRQRGVIRLGAAMAADLAELWGPYAGMKRGRTDDDQDRDDAEDVRARRRQRLDDDQARAVVENAREHVRRRLDEARGRAHDEELARRQQEWTVHNDDDQEDDDDRAWDEGPSEPRRARA